jgi:photosystem II stability/assembly factor-like uncharacterized protein
VTSWCGLAGRGSSLACLAVVVIACLMLGACGGATAPPDAVAVRAAAAATTPGLMVGGVKFLSAAVGWADTGSRLMMTTDGGDRWVDVSPPALRARGRILAGGLAGGFFHSRSDFWISVFDLEGEGLRSVEVLHTTDAGRTWIDSGSFPRDYGDAWLSFVSRSHGWLMVGSGGEADQESVTIYQTHSEGRRWSELARSRSPLWSGTPGAPSPGCDKSGFSFSSPSSGWISGYCNGPLVLQHTRDGGRRWSVLALGASNPKISYGADASPPTFFSQTRGVMQARLGTAHGLRDTIYTTTDGGITWTLHRPPMPAAGPVFVLSSGTWFVANGRILYVTTDAGTVWTAVRSSIAFSGVGMAVLDFVSRTAGWTVTAAGKLWKTTDGGRTWVASSL